MKVSASKIWNELNHTKIAFNGENKCTYFSIPKNFRFNRQNNKTYDLQYINSNNNNQ